MEEMIKNTLPKRYTSFFKDVPMYNYQGHWNDQEFLQGTILAQQNFKPHPTHIFLCSCPKTGTTWLKAMAFAIVTRKKFDKCNNPLLTTMPHDCVPFLEKDLDKIQDNSGDFPLIGTHLPYGSLPESVISSDCKIVYIYRNAKDVVVSYYHFVRKFAKLTEEEAPFEKTFEEFCEGFSWYGPYWDHILGYWKASLERPGRILFLKYEDMKMDASESVKKLAEFMGYQFSIEEVESGVVEDIVELCSFENLSNLEVNKTGKHRPDKETTTIENKLYFRKAEVGDWENYLSDETKEKLDKLMSKKLSGTGLVLT